MSDSPEDSGLAGFYRTRIDRTQQAMQAWLGDVRPQKRHLRTDVVAGLPGAISSVPAAWPRACWPESTSAHGLYASFAGPIAAG